MKKLFILKAIVFISAFLLFQIELIISKAILPGFGGSYLVWGACVFFFQGVLLLGYGYAHLVGRVLPVGKYRIVQALIIFLPLVFFPVDLKMIAAPAYRLPFVVEIVWLLLRSIGLIFFVLSTVSVITQNVLSSSGLPGSDDPYFLYGWSNLGSFLALVSYPLLFEPFLTQDIQLLIWEAAYVVLAIISAVGFGFLIRDAGAARPAAGQNHSFMKAGKVVIFRWFLLGAAGSAMFLSVTTVITFNLPSIPLFWILPLGIYLFSFFLNFKQNPWRPDWIRERIFIVVPLAVYLFLMMIQSYLVPVSILLAGHLGILFIFCMYCQGELADNRPPDVRNLTTFYLTIATGSFAGSALASWIIPSFSTSLLEYLAGFLLISLAGALGKPEQKISLRTYLLALAVVPVAILWPVAMSVWGSDKAWLIAAGAGLPLLIIYYLLADNTRAVSVSLLAIFLLVPFLDYFRVDRDLVFKGRNFYGIYRVYDKDGKRFLRHGAALHGAQFLDPTRQSEPLLYYHRSAPAGEIFTSGLFKFKDIAIVGLGTGALAAYSKPGQTVDIYELDPGNEEVARKYFSYLADSRGRVNLMFGDARLSLQRAGDKKYDIMVIDAFNSDSIPVHLITTNAIHDYFSRLREHGLILFHISNRHLNLAPVLSANARILEVSALFKSNRASVHRDSEVTDWVAMTGDQGAAEILLDKLKWEDMKDNPKIPSTRPWTDQFSNLISALLAN